MRAGVLLALCLCGPAAAAATELLSLRAFGPGDGLPQMTVLAIAQDRAGYLYVGTQDGLARYDGRRFEALPLRPGLRDVVSELLADDAGQLWIGSSENGLFLRAADGGIAAVALSPTLTEGNAIEALALGRAPGEIWVGTPQGLYRCAGRDCRAVPGTAELPVSTLLEGRGPAGPCLWVGTNSIGVLRFDHGADGQLRRAAESYDRDDGLPNPVIRALAHFGGDADAPWPPLWIGTGRGVARVDGNGVTAFDPRAGLPIGSAMAMAVTQAPGQAPRLYVASYGGGLVHFEADGRFGVQSLNEGLPERFLYSLLAREPGPGHASQLWIGTASAGLLRAEPGRWLTLDERHVLPARTVVATGLLGGHDGRQRLWAGTLSGAVLQEPDGQWRYLLPRAWWTSVVYSAVVDPRGRLWAGTLGGLLRVDGDQVRLFDAEGDGLPGVAVHQLLWRGGVDGELWIGTGHGLARWRESGLARLHDDVKAMHNTGIRALVELPGSADEVAIATANGLFLSDGVRARALPDGCLPHSEILDLIRAGDGGLWAATREGAVYLAAHGDSYRCHVLRLPGDGPRTAYALALDRRGRLYVFGYDGARRFDNPVAAARDGAAPVFLHYGLDDGLPSLEFNRDAVIDGEGRLWAANNGGLAMLDTGVVTPVPPPAPLRLQAFVGTRPLAEGEALAHEHEQVRFSFRLLAFDGEHRLRYRSRLLGLEDQAAAWLATGERRFNRLPPGRYRFELEARDAHGQIVRAPPWSFSVRYPLWQHPLALAAATAVLIGAGALWGRRRARRLSERAAELEREVAARTAALETANRALSQASLTDPLTGCHNRRHFHAEFPAWRARGGGRDGLWLLLIDIDHFKAINDGHGHDAGDAVLVEVAARLRHALGPDGELVRWGGEEFLGLWPGANGLDIRARLQALMTAIAGAPVPVATGTLTVHVSIGAARARADEGESVEALLKRADLALYEAKRSGRDRARIDAGDGTGTTLVRDAG